MLLGLSETVDKLAMANHVHWYGHVLRWEHGRVVRGALKFKDVRRRKKGRMKRIRKRQVEEEGTKVDLCRRNAIC